MTGMEPLVGGMKNNWGNACNSIFHISYFEFLIVKWFLEFLEFLELFWIFFGTGNVLDKSICSGIILEFKIFTINSFCYNISGCPLFGSPICDKVLFQFCLKQPQ